MKFAKGFSLLALLLFAAQVNAAQLTLNFTDNANNETGVNVERCQNSGCTAFAKITTLAANVTTYVDQALAEGVTFCYRVQAVNSTGVSAYSNTACATTAISLPAAPSNLTVQ